MRQRVLTIHGIESSGDWQEDVARAFAPHFDCKTIKYPHYRWLGPLKLLLEPYVLLVLGVIVAIVLFVMKYSSRTGWVALAFLFLIAYFASYWRRSCAFNHVLKQVSLYANPDDQSETHLIAHSLGTYFMGLALRKRANIHLGRIILVGCVLPRSFPWKALTALSGTGYRFINVRNEVGRRDVVVWSAWAMSWLVRGLGVAGLRGFKGEEKFIHTLSTPGISCPQGNSCSAKIHNMLSEYLGHSDAFVGSGYAEAFWLPYLWEIEPEEYQQLRLSCKLAAGLERPWSAGARAQGHVDPRLIAVENKLLGSIWRWCNGSFAQYVQQEVASKRNVSGKELDQLTALAARGVWQVIHLAAQARLNRQDRLTTQPLAYLVEAADDISYCISDMEDGIDQGVFTLSDFFSGIQDWIGEKNPKQPALTELRKSAEDRSRDAEKNPSNAKDHFMRFKTVFSRTMIEEAARLYGDGNSEDIRHGTRSGLLDGTDADDLLEHLKDIARQLLYPADKVQRPFLAGLKVMHGTLDEFGRLLKLTQGQFALLRKAWKSADRKAAHDQKLETLLPLLDSLPSHYLDVYDSTASDTSSVQKWGKETWEWFCRAHLIVDYLSGMTDDFAYRTYQVISGAKLE